MYSLNELHRLRNLYKNGLLLDTLPFWLEHAIDKEYGGYIFNLDREGKVLDYNKGIWQHGRFIWLLSTMYQQIEQRSEWLESAEHGLKFLQRYGFDADGRMFFQITRDGRPLRKRRYIFSECFAVMALAAYAKATGDAGLVQKAVDLFKLIIKYHTEGLLPPKINPETRPVQGLAMPMCLISVAQVLSTVTDDPICSEWIDRSIATIERCFMKPDLQAVLEMVGPNGEFIDSFDGRLVTPGHSIEAAWFILWEAKRRGQGSEAYERLIRLGLTILDWSWQLGWDTKYGGILYYCDAKGLPCTEYWHDMKFWWPHNETIIATLLAYLLTNDQKYAGWHRLVHEWSYSHFPDPEYGEWFGYLHRDGSLSTTLKGNLWKGPFHLPRMQLICWQITDELIAKAQDKQADKATS